MLAFAVEMSELRVILKNADKNSLILGDELCSGTETQSALSIFVAGLMDLREKAASFIFATHFHQMVKGNSAQLAGQLEGKGPNNNNLCDGAPMLPGAG